MSDKLNFALPPKPVVANSDSKSSSSTGKRPYIPKPILPSRPLGLPAKPDFIQPTSSKHSTSIESRGFHSRSPSPDIPSYRRAIDTYLPDSPSPPRGADHYIADLTPSPPRRSKKDTYIASPSPPRKRYRSPSPLSYSRSYPHSHSHSRYRSPSPVRTSSRHYSTRSSSGPATPRGRSHTRSRSPKKPRSPPRQATQEAKSLEDRLGGFFDRPAKREGSPIDPPPAKVAKKPIAPTVKLSSIPTGPRSSSTTQLQTESVPEPTPVAPAVPPRATPVAIPFGAGRALGFGPKPPKAIPTGPRSSLAGSSSPNIPTGPRAYNNVEPRQPAKNEIDSSASHDTDMPKPRSNGQTRRSTPPKQKPERQQLGGQEHDANFILATYGKGVTLKPQWEENPKGPLANYIGGGTGGGNLEFEVQEGMIGSKILYRAQIIVDEEKGIAGVGDHQSKKEAEKLAALSAVYQLCAGGFLDKGKSGKATAVSSSSAPTDPSPAASTETAELSDGTSISYDRARQFMDYYCQRYKFGKPDIEFTETTTKVGRKGKGGIIAWDAVMTVGGKVIGMGQASNKKGAQIKTYLDVTQYLESCDPELWRDFVEHSKQDTSANLGLAPHLVFQMSDQVNDEITAMSDDIRRSTLYKNAPSSGVAEHQALPVWQSGRGASISEDRLETKSVQLRERLDAYRSDPSMEKLREQRDSLPVAAQATSILAKIQVNDVTIIMAATGSGKTTQVPQLLLDDFINQGKGAECNVLCTQPRRLAAMSVAERIAEERGQRLGREVGYQVRFDAKLPEPHGSISFCTTGIFLKRMQSALGNDADPKAVEAMDRVTHIVVDEVHERDVDTDLSLVVLKRLLADRKARNKPLKIILMSATIDPTLFQRYFVDERDRPAPVAEVPGRTYPVQRHFLDDFLPELKTGLLASMGGWVFEEKNVAEYLSKEMSPDKNAFNPTTGMELEIPYPLVALTIAHVMRQSDDGHVLVFLPGWDEIKKVANILLDTSGRFPLLGLNFSDPNRYSVHYLHSTIPAAEQREVFKPPPQGVRRIILATNIAETSITIPDVVYVVDGARVKEKRYDPDRHMSSLVSAWVGSSNLGQRAGRAGRHREGEYFGLLSKNRYEALEKHQTVEMKRADLSNVVMHVKALNLGQVEDVLAAVIEPPEPSRIVSAMDTLRMLGAMDLDQDLTSLGRVLLQLPVEAAIGKLCLYGSFFRCLDSALTLAAILTNRDPFLAPLAMKQTADEVKDSWSPFSFRSDPLAIWAAYNTWTKLDDVGNYQQAHKFTIDNFLAKPTLLQIKQVKASLLQSLDSAGVIAVSAGGTVRDINLSRKRGIPDELRENDECLPLLAALIAMSSAPNFALRTSERTCRTAKDKVVFIHGSSVNSRKREVVGYNAPSTSFNPAEKRLYAFTEKIRNIPPGSNPSAAITQLRNVTRLDPMTYMLFGAYNLVVTEKGLECDGWLPVTGNLYGLDDVQRLKGLLERCMLRVFEGVGKSLTKGRDERWRDARKAVDTRAVGSSLISGGDDDGQAMEEGEVESDDEDGEVNENGNGETSKISKKSRLVEPLSLEEIKELDLLTTDVVRILNMYATERETGMRSRPQTPGGGHGNRTPPYSGHGFGLNRGGGAGGMGSFQSYGAGNGGGVGVGLYQPPGKRW